MAVNPALGDYLQVRRAAALRRNRPTTRRQSLRPTNLPSPLSTNLVAPQREAFVPSNSRLANLPSRRTSPMSMGSNRRPNPTGDARLQIIKRLLAARLNR